MCFAMPERKRGMWTLNGCNTTSLVLGAVLVLCCAQHQPAALALQAKQLVQQFLMPVRTLIQRNIPTRN